MATPAERQRRYRAARKDQDGPQEKQVNMVLDVDANLALSRLAKHRGTTRKALVEALVLAAQAEALSGMSAAEQAAYQDSVTA